MNKFFKIFSLSILAGCLLIAPTFATEGWPTDNNEQVQVFDNSGSATQETLNIFDSSTQSQSQESNMESTMSPTDKSVETPINQPVFDSSIRDIPEVDLTDTTNLLPDVSIDDAVEWGQRKSYEIIHLMQTFVQPICVIAFIISAFLFLFGTIAHNKLASQGLMGLFCAAVVYALVMFAPIIVQTFTAWVAS